MCRKSLKVLGLITLVSFMAPQAADAQNTVNGFIITDEWNGLYWMENPFGAGPAPGVMKGNWIAPSVIGDAGFNPNGDNAGGEFHGAPGPFPAIDFGGAAQGPGYNIGGLAPFPIWVTNRLIEAAFPVTLRRDQGNTLLNWQGYADDINNQFIDTDMNGAVDAGVPATGRCPDDNVMAVSTTYIELVGVSGSINLCTGSDDSIQVWINNKCVLNKSIPRGSGGQFTCQETTTVLLNEGVSKVSMLVFEGGGGFNARCGFQFPDGTPLEDGMDLTGDGESNYNVLGAGGGALEGQTIYCVDRSIAPAPADCYATPTKVTLHGMGAEDDNPDDTLVIQETIVANDMDSIDITDVSNEGQVFSVITEFPPQPCAPTVIEELSTVAFVGNDAGGGSSDTEDAPGEYTSVSTSGGDIWTGGDDMIYRYDEIEGDFDISAELLEYAHDSGAGRWGKFGLMARQIPGDGNPDRTSRFTMTQAHGPSNDDQARQAGRRGTDGNPGNGMFETPGGSGPRPRFMRLTRRDNVFSTWFSAAEGLGDESLDPCQDNNWVNIANENWGDGAPESVHVGFANSEHNSDGAIPQTIRYRLIPHVDQPQPPDELTAYVVQWIVSRDKMNTDGVCYNVVASSATSHSGIHGILVDENTFAPVGTVGGASGVPFIAETTGPIGEFDNSHQIGDQPVRGSVTHDPGDPDDPKDDVYTVAGTGTDIWDGGDRFQYAYKNVTGDFQATARITGVHQNDADGNPQPGNNRWGRVGIMARYSCATNSAYAFAMQPYRGEVLRDNPDTGDNDRRGHQRRRTHLNNGETLDDQVVPNNTAASHRRDDGGPPAHPFNGWLRLSRCGDVMFSEFAPDVDGAPGDWVLGGASTHAEAPDSLLVGLAVGAHGSGGGDGNNALTVIYDNWCCEAKSWPDRWCAAEGDPVIDEDFDGDDGSVEELDGGGLVVGPWATATNNAHEPGRVGGRLRITADAVGGTAAQAFYDAGGLGLVDGFKASVCAFYNGNGTPADGFVFCVADGMSLDQVNGNRNLGDAGGAEGYRGGDRHDLNRRWSTSFGCELDNWNGGAGSNDGVGGNNSAELYHLGVNTSWTHQSQKTGPMPAIYNTDRGIQLMLSYDPNAGPDGKDERARLTVTARIVDTECNPIDVIGEDADGNEISGDLGKVLDQFVPRLSDDDSVLIGFAGGTGGATADAEFDNLQVWTSCNEDQDSVTIEGNTGEIVYVGDTVTYNAAGSGIEGEGTYTWTVVFDGEIVAQTDGAVFEAQCPQEGTYTITVVCEDEIDCCPAASDSIEVVCERSTIGKHPCDYNNDGNFDLSDPVALLSYLFTGGPEYKPGDGCNDAALALVMDSNGDGNVDLSDAVSKLSYLFLGGPEPAPLSNVDGNGCVQIECAAGEDSCGA